MASDSVKEKKKLGNAIPKLNRAKRPEGMTLEEWQIALRKDHGRKQNFHIQNVGDAPIFSEFTVRNPQSHGSYRVVIRGAKLGDNSCTCGDFLTNTLGTCKHIEYTLAHLENNRGGCKSLGEGRSANYSEIYLRYGNQREVIFCPGTDCSRELDGVAREYFSAEGVLHAEAAEKFDEFLDRARTFEHELRVQDDVAPSLAEKRDVLEREEILNREYPCGAKSATLKKLLKVPLFDYQAEGALFAARAGRCLIGDEMGLGKTIQAIAAIELMARHFGVERVLVVCPTSLKHQWQREIERFSDHASQIINGGQAVRAAQFRETTAIKIMNYDTIHADLDRIGDWAPDLVILDEAQRIKNWNTRVARSVKKIDCPYAVVLTGTPLENRLEELISIVQFVDRNRLGPTFRLLENHQDRDEAGKVIGYKNLGQIGKTLEPVLLRRRKAEVLDQLPERLDKNLFVPMSELQMQQHDEGKLIVARIVQKWRRYQYLSEIDKQKLMAAMQGMRMSCDSSYLLDPTTNEGFKVGEATSQLEEMFAEEPVKVVIFSQWLRMHELLVKQFIDKCWGHVFFHGGVPSAKRQDLVDKFRNDPECRLFLATDAGSVGLNLQFASVVLNMDLPWNPAVLEQRIGRVYRLGQERKVQVVNFVARGSIEEGMLSVLKFKKSLFAGVLDGGETDIKLGGSRLTKFMETVEQTTQSIPAVVSMAYQGEFEFEDSKAGEKAEVNLDVATPSQTPSALASDPLAGLVQTGLAFLQSLSAIASPSMGSGRTLVASSSPLVARDEKTGESFLKLPMPSPDALKQLMSALSALLPK